MLWRRPQLTFPSEGTTGWLPWARPRAGVPTVEVVVAGRRVTALVDSGAQYSVIDRSLFSDLGLKDVFDLPLVAYGVGGNPQVGRGVTLDVSVGALTIAGLRAAILNLGPLADQPGLSTPLILGQDVLRTLILELDPVERRLALTATEVHAPAADLSPVPVALQRGALTAEVTVEGAVIRAVVDTGASALLSLSAEAAAGAGLLDGRPAEAGASIVLGGVTGARLVTARTVTFADELYRDARVAIYADVPLPGFPAALLGMGAFANRRLVMDLDGGRLLATRPLDLTVGRPGSRRG